MTSCRSTLTPMRRRAVDRLLVRYFDLDRPAQPEFLAKCRRRWPRLAGWLTELAGDTVSLIEAPVHQLAEEVVRCHTPLKPLPAGTRLGPWRVVDAVGRGGMGMVYRGQRADGAFEMEVAIKLIGKPRPGLAEMLQRECRLLARLDHPAVTRLLDAGLDGSAGPFLVMEWIEGVDLENWLADQAGRIDRQLECFEQVVDAVWHAHQQLIVHGDIKPGNVRIRPDGQVKLMDFGVARMLGDDRDDRSFPALTPSFAAPELLSGGEATPKSDIWALGALLFWLVHEGLAPNRATSNPPTVAGLGRRRRNELNAIINRAMANDPGHRYGDSGSLLADVRRFRGHRPVSALPNTWRYRMGKFIRRNPVLAGTSALTAVMLTAGLALVLVMFFEAEKARQQTAVERDRAEQHARDLAQVAAFQETQLAGIDAADMGRRMHTDLMDMAKSVLADRHQEPEYLEASMEQFRRSLDGVNLTDLALRTLDENIFERTRTAIDKQFSDRPVIRAQLLQSLATTLREVGLLDRAREPQQEAYRIRQDQLGKGHPSIHATMMEMAFLEVAMGNYQAALDLLERRLELQITHVGRDDPATLATINSIGSLHFYLGDPERAKHHYRQALDKRRAVLGKDHTDTAFTMTGLGAALRATGQPDKAGQYLKPALETLIDVHGEEHHRSRNTLGQIASTLVEQQEFEQARQTFERLLQIERRVLGDRHPETLSTVHRTGRVYKLLGEYEAAASLIHEAKQGRRDVLGKHHPQTRDSLQLLAELYVAWDGAQPGAGFDDHAEQWRSEMAAVTASASGPDRDR